MRVKTVLSAFQDINISYLFNGEIVVLFSEAISNKYAMIYNMVFLTLHFKV